MKPLFVSFAVLFSAAPACANGYYTLVGYECDKKANAVILSYTGAFNEAGKKLMRNKGPRQWNPWSLMNVKGDLITSLKTAGGKCELGDGAYTIKVGAAPGNFNLQGMCGGFTSAWAEVKRGPETVLPRHEFEHPDCHNSDSLVTVKIVIEAGKKPVITTVPRNEFRDRSRKP